MVWGTRLFGGARPRMDARLLEQQQAALARNCWLTSGTMRPVPLPVPLDPAVALPPGTETIYRFTENQWFAWPHDVDVVPAPLQKDAVRRTYWTGDDFPRMTTTAIMGAFASPGVPISRRLGIPVPGGAPVPAAQMQANVDSSVSEAEHSWVFTYVSDLDEEGAPSPPSPVTTRTFNTAGEIQSVMLTIPVAPAGPYGINRKRIYRTLTGLSGETTFNLVAEIPVAQTEYVDSKLGSALGEQIISTGWDPPPDALTGLIDLPNGVLAGFVGRDVYLSEPYQGHAWPTEYIQTVEADIVALAAFGTTVVVLTEGQPSLLVGSHPAEMAEADVELDQACVAKHSVARIGQQGIVYASPDGLVLLGPRGGQLVSRQSYTRKEWQALGPGDIVAFYHDNLYVAFLEERAIASAPESGDILEFDHTTRTGFVDRASDRLYIVRTNAIREFRTAQEGGEELATALWRSGIEIGPARTFSTAQVTAKSYPVTLRLFAEGDQVHSRQVLDERPFRLPPIARSGEWYYELEGTAEVEEVRIGSMPEMLGATIVPGRARIELRRASLTVDEGGTALIEARLSRQPTGDVTVMAAESSPYISVSPDQRIFTPDNWDTYQLWTVSGLEDADTTDESATVTLTATGAATDSATVSVTVRDDDTPVATPRIQVFASLVMVDEGGTAMIQARLTGQPASDVTITATESSPDISIADPAARVFTPDNWQAYQSWTVNGDQDADTADENATVTLTATGGASDTASVIVRVTDDDMPVAATYYLGVSDDAAFAPAEFTVSGTGRALAVPGAPTWPDGVRRYIGYARPTTLGNYTALHYYPAGSPNTRNGIGSWMQEADTIMIGGVECTVLRTRFSGRDSARGRIVEAI